MSWWIYKKDKGGKVYLISMDVVPYTLPTMILLALITAVFVPLLIRQNPKAIIEFFLWSSFACLLAAKISLFRRGIWFSWGSEKMTKLWSRVYKVGYVLMAIGAVMTIAAYRAMQ